MTKQRRHNSTFAIGGASCFADSFVVTESSVLRMNICAKKPAHRKSAKRYVRSVKNVSFFKYLASERQKEREYFYERSIY